jgi:predicted TIM-barrel fold metal-dependent hydrolase
MTKIIDPHIHLFNLTQGDYHWLRPENPPYWSDKADVSRNVFEAELTLKTPLALAGYVHIEAGFDNAQPHREIAWLAQHCKMPMRAIAMTDITLPADEFAQSLKALTHFPSVVGGRYILDDDALTILKQKNVERNLSLMAEQGLLFELQMPIAETRYTNAFVDIIKNIPTLKVCINHAGSINLDQWQGTEQQARWRENLSKLSSFNNIALKCSGFEMTDRAFSFTTKQAVITDCIKCFGTERTMLASNFPLSLWRESYQSSWENSIVALKALTLNGKMLDSKTITKLCYDNAYNFYGFSSSI